MKNVTVAVPDDVYRAARIHAAEQGTSVSALVTEHLRALTSKDAEFDRRQAQQQEVLARIHQSGRGFDASDRLSRDELYDQARSRQQDHAVR